MIVNPLNNIRIRNVILASTMALLAVVLINFRGTWNAALNGSINSLITVGVAWTATVLCWYYRSLLNKADPIEKVWRYFGIGLGLWTLAELLWLILTVKGSGTTYPSLADVLWVVGHIFFFLPLFLLYRILQINPGLRSIFIIFGFALAYIFFVDVYVITPIVQDPASSAFEKALGAIYPIEDLLVALGAAFLALALTGGAFSWVWTFIAVGLISQSFSDTLFVYADWNGLYLSGGSTNFLSQLIDITHILGYLLLALGIYVQIEFSINGISEPLSIRHGSYLTDESGAYQDVKITLFVDEGNRVVSASPTLAYLLPRGKRPMDMYGRPVNQALGLDFEYTSQILQEMKQNKSLSPRTIDLVTADGQTFGAQISGAANIKGLKRYIGADITVTLRRRGDASINAISMNPGISATTNVESYPLRDNLKERLASDLFARKIYRLYVVVSRFGGINVAKSLQRTFNAKAHLLNVAVRMDGPNVIFEARTHDLENYRELLNAIISYSIAITSLEVVKREINKAEDGLDPVLIQAGKEIGLYGLNLEH